MKNLLASPAVSVRVAGEEHAATARVVERNTAEDERARQLLLEKYQAPGNHDLESWGRTATIVAVDLKGPSAG